MVLASTVITKKTGLPPLEANQSATFQSLFTNTLIAKNVQLSKGLVLSLNLDETLGKTAFDSSPNGRNNNGRLSQGAAFQFVGGDLKGGVQFDGQNDVISIKNSPDINLGTHAKRTISVWFNANDVDIRDRKQVIYEEGGGNRGLNIYLDQGQLYVGGWNKQRNQRTSSFLSTDTVISGQWHHITLVLDAQEGSNQAQSDALSAYLDGEKFAQGSSVQLRSHGGNIGVGRVKGKTRFHDGISSDFNGFAGNIADVKVYNQALSAKRINALASLTTPITLNPRTLDGSGNNPIDSALGQVGSLYRRLGDPNYSDGISEPLTGPDPRYISNRVFQDLGQNLFSENNVTQWGATWGQFLDHTFGLRVSGTERTPIPFDANDPLETFRNDLGSIDFTRSAAAPGSGDTTPREQANTVSSFIDGWAIYGGTDERLEFLREGPVDGDLSNNGARLLLTDDGFLPTADIRGDASTAPMMELQGRLRATPEKAVITGDIRANENILLTATHTLFAREHNRIVDALPNTLNEETKFQIARKVIGAEQQYITYQEFLPALGLDLAPYRGYDSSVDPRITNEFATIGYRAHSLIHGEIEFGADLDRFSTAELDAFEASGIEVEVGAEGVEIAVPLNVAFGNPGLVNQIGVDLLTAAVAGEAQYKNDEQIDNQLRSVLFQLPTNPGGELDGPDLPQSFSTVLDLGATHIQRSRDHGIPLYNDLREVYGLERIESFTALTGESTDEFPDHPSIDADDPINDPDILQFDTLFDLDGNVIPAGEEDNIDAVTGIRRSTLAARLKAIYGDVDNVDAFVGMVSEDHLAGSEFGELQSAIWTQQFEAIRDGDRFFYKNDPDLANIEARYGISFERSLSEIMADNTAIAPGDIQNNVFLVSEAQPL